jgi:hypothetical protein
MAPITDFTSDGTTTGDIQTEAVLQFEQKAGIQVAKRKAREREQSKHKAQKEQAAAELKAKKAQAKVDAKALAAAKVRKTPSWPRSWADFSLL